MFDEFDNLELPTKCPIEGRFGSYVTKDGETVNYFQSDCSEEAMIQRFLASQPDYDDLDPYEDERALKEHLRRLDKVDGYRVRRELGDKLVNLGSRVNRVPSRCKHW